MYGIVILRSMDKDQGSGMTIERGTDLNPLFWGYFISLMISFYLWGKGPI